MEEEEKGAGGGGEAATCEGPEAGSEEGEGGERKEEVPVNAVFAHLLVVARTLDG